MVKHTIFIFFSLLFSISTVYSSIIYPLEQYFVLNFNYCSRLNKEINYEDPLNSVYKDVKALLNVRRAIKRSPNKFEDIQKVFLGNDTVNLSDYFGRNPYEVFIKANPVTRMTVCEFVVDFGSEILKHKRNQTQSYINFNIYQEDILMEKKLTDHYINMLTMGKQINLDDVLEQDLMEQPEIDFSVYPDLEEVYNYALNSLNDINLTNMIFHDETKHSLANLFYKYGSSINYDVFLDRLVEKLITKSQKMGRFLDSQEKWSEIKLFLKYIFEEYQFPMNYSVFFADTDSTLFSDFFDTEINQLIYEIFSYINSNLHSKTLSSITMLIGELTINSFDQMDISENLEISDEKFKNSINEIFSIFSKSNDFVKKLSFEKHFSMELLIEQIINAQENSYITMYDDMVLDNNILDQLISYYDVVVKYVKSKNVDLYNRLKDYANYYIDMYATLKNVSVNQSSILNKELEIENISGIGKYIYTFSNKFTQEDYYKNIISATELLKRDLNSIFLEGETLNRGFERNICLEIQTKKTDKAYISNKINKDCIFYGTNAANEAVYELVKFYYDTFIVYSNEDLKIKNITESNIDMFYGIYAKGDNKIFTFELPIINTFRNLEFTTIHSIFDYFRYSHEDDYIKEAAKLIKSMGLYMIDSNLLIKNLNLFDSPKFELKDIYLPKSKTVIPEMKYSSIDWGYSLIDTDYNDYFEYQYYSLIYYIDDQEKEDLNLNSDLVEKLIKIKAQAFELIRNVNSYENSNILSMYIDHYENFVRVLSEYIYESNNFVNKNSILPDENYQQLYFNLIEMYNELETRIELAEENSDFKEIYAELTDTQLKENIYNYIDYSEIVFNINYINSKTDIDIIDMHKRQLEFVFGSVKATVNAGYSIGIGAAIGVATEGLKLRIDKIASKYVAKHYPNNEDNDKKLETIKARTNACVDVLSLTVRFGLTYLFNGGDPLMTIASFAIGNDMGTKGFPLAKLLLKHIFMKRVVISDNAENLIEAEKQAKQFIGDVKNRKTDVEKANSLVENINSNKKVEGEGTEENTNLLNNDRTSELEKVGNTIKGIREGTLPDNLENRKVIYVSRINFKKIKKLILKFLKKDNNGDQNDNNSREKIVKQGNSELTEKANQNSVKKEANMETNATEVSSTSSGGSNSKNPVRRSSKSNKKVTNKNSRLTLSALRIKGLKE